MSRPRESGPNRRRKRHVAIRSGYLASVHGHLFGRFDTIRAFQYLVVVRCERRPPTPSTSILAAVVSSSVMTGGCTETPSSLDRDSAPLAVRTNANGQAYRDLCTQTHRVPVPNRVLDSSWENHGEITIDFASMSVTRNNTMSPTLEPELWSWKTPPGDPNPGYCVALPRWETDVADAFYNRALVFGIICVSRTTSHACFFDNAAPDKMERYRDHSISRFIGGADLYPNGQGVCSGCHAGYNPIVVHPHDDAFRQLNAYHQPDGLNPPSRYTPVIPQAPTGQDEWPDNPNSLTALPPGNPMQDSCLRCHVVGGTDGAGPLPRFWELPRDTFCQSVLQPAIEQDPLAGPSNPVGRTMPAGHEMPSTLRTPRPDRTNFIHQIDWLDSLCNAPWNGQAGEVATDPPDASVLVPTPPVLLGPIYECVTSVEVDGVIPGTTLEVVSAMGAGSIGSASPTEAGKISISLTSSLTASDTLKVEVYRGATYFGDSNSREVLAPPTEAPSRPTIAGPVHQCATRLGVYKIRGARVTMSRNGGTPSSVQNDDDFAIFNLGTPVQAGPSPDEFEVTQSVCGSPQSAPAVAVATVLQGPIPRPRFPDRIYAGQENIDIFGLTTGADVELWNSTVTGAVWTINSWPFSGVRASTGGVTQTSLVWIKQRLCSTVWTEAFMEPESAVGCSPGAPPPDVAPPQAGDVLIIVTDLIPGGVAHLWINGAYVASTGGPIISLPAPLVAGDVVVVSQSVGNCSGERGVSWLIQ